ncbi:MAG: glycosyltransferase [Polyangiales bacterium]
MKVLDVNEFFADRGGGVRTYVHRKLEAGAARGVSVVVVAPGPEDRVEQRYGGKVVWVRSPTMPLDSRYHVLARERAVHAVIAQERPDVIEGSSPWSGGWFAARAPGRAPRVLVFHQDAVAVYGHSLLDGALRPDTVDRAALPYWRYLRQLSRHFDHTVVSGAWLAQRLARFGVHAPTTVRFGVDRQRFAQAQASATRRADLLARCGLSPRATLLLAVSRLHPEKRVGTLMDAVGHLQGSPVFPHGVGLAIVGDGPLAPYYRRRAAATAGVHLVGFVDEPGALPEMMASADAFVHGSSAETYGLVVGEALAAGLPLVVPDAGGAAELAGAEYAERYRAGDAAGCADAIERLGARDPVRMRAAARRAGQTQVLDAAGHFDELFSTYEALAGARRPDLAPPLKLAAARATRAG